MPAIYVVLVFVLCPGILLGVSALFSSSVPCGVAASALLAAAIGAFEFWWILGSAGGRARGVGDISGVARIRTDTTFDHRQKAEAMFSLICGNSAEGLIGGVGRLGAKSEGASARTWPRSASQRSESDEHCDGDVVDDLPREADLQLLLLRVWPAHMALLWRPVVPRVLLQSVFSQVLLYIQLLSAVSLVSVVYQRALILEWPSPMAVLVLYLCERSWCRCSPRRCCASACGR